ncbi:MAG: VCBS repeat-containing protein, partial [Actinobacteria bacterium]|nr:VCBS repeat-containing protein [Actinomycetota bacterium]
INADGTGPAIDISNTPFGGEFDPDWHPLFGTLPLPPTTTTTTAPPIVLPPASFAPATTHPTGTTFNPWQVAVADFNRDGIADLAVASPMGNDPEFKHRR